jgi:metal-responsive CopG/Arc/MetJ family transcriptional regulator
MVGKDKVRVLITITKEMKDDIETLAEKETRSVSNLISFIIKEYIKNNKFK